MLRIVANGLILNDNSYLRNRWNIIDGTVAVAG